MGKIVIIAGADIDRYDWLANQITTDDVVICADSGLRHAHEIGLTPHIIIGDFDSVDHDLLHQYKEKSDIIHAEDQNSTDLMKALDVALNHPPATPHKTIDIFGACGQRADHDFANYLILLAMPNPNHITLKTPYDDRRVIKTSLKFHADIGEMVGVFPLLPITTLAYKGLEYQAKGIGGPYHMGWNGACNRVIGHAVEINIDSGAALVTRTYLPLK